MKVDNSVKLNAFKKVKTS